MGSGGGLVGVVTLCGDVGLVGGGREMVRLKGLGGVVYPQEGMTKRDLLSSFAPCTVDGAAHLHKNTKGTHIMISRVINCIAQCCMKTLKYLLSRQPFHTCKHC